MRTITIAAAQTGASQKPETSKQVVSRMMFPLEQAGEAGCDLIVFPELCLTTFFPRWHTENKSKIEAWFEAEMPGPESQSLFDEARDPGVAMSLGYAEQTGDEHRFNRQVMTDKSGTIAGKYRKVHLPGHAEYDEKRALQHLEKS